MDKQPYYEKHLAAAKRQKELGIASPSAGIHGYKYAYDWILALGYSPYVENNFKEWY